MEKHRRINTSIEETLYRRLLRIKDKYGFKTICELNVAVLNILATHVEAAEQTARRMEHADIYDEIDMMFNELGSWEKVPDGKVPKRGHRPKNL
jgi:hypothetical protein